MFKEKQHIQLMTNFNPKILIISIQKSPLHKHIYLCVICFHLFICTFIFFAISEYKKTLENAISGDTSGHFRRLLISLAQVQIGY